MARDVMLLLGTHANLVFVRSRRSGVQRLEIPPTADGGLARRVDEGLSLARQHARGSSVLVVVPNELAQVKRLHGLDRHMSSEAVSDLLSTDPSAFLLGDTSRLVTSSGELRDDAWSVAVMRREDYGVILQRVVAAEFRLRGIVPALAFGEVPTDALAEAVLERHEEVPLIIDPGAQARARRAARRWRFGLMGLGVVLALAAAAGPWLVFRVAARREALSDPSVGLTRDRLEDALTKLRRPRASLSLALSRIVTSLPDGAVLQALEADSVRFRITLLAPPGSMPISALAQRPDLGDVSLAGPILPVIEDGAEMERYQLALEPIRPRRAVPIGRTTR